MRGDDYVGSFIVKKLLNEIRTQKVILFDAEDGVEWVISKVGRPNLRHLIIIDACEMNTKPGEVALIPLAKTDYPFFTTHGIPLKLLTSKLLPDVDASILAIQPGRMGLNEELSPEVSVAATSILALIANAVKESEWYA
jgi:hydrogenase 3 maturation protease